MVVIAEHRECHQNDTDKFLLRLSPFELHLCLVQPQVHGNVRHTPSVCCKYLSRAPSPSWVPPAANEVSGGRFWQVPPSCCLVGAASHCSYHKKTKPTTQIKMPCSFFPLPSTQNSTFADLAPLPRLAGERRATLSTVPLDRIGSHVCLRIQFNQMPLPVCPFNKARPPPLPARDLLLAQQS